MNSRRRCARVLPLAAVVRVREGSLQEWAYLPSNLALIPRGAWSRARLLSSGAVQLEGLAPALPVYSELPASGAHLRTLVRWLCVIVPLRGDSEVYVARGARMWRGRLRALGMAFPRSLLRPRLALQTNSGSLITSPSIGPRTSPTF